MSTSSNSEASRQLNIITLILVAYSLVFFVVLANGYVHLLAKLPWFLPYIASAVLAFIAWAIGWFIGSTGGIRKHLPMFVLMLLLSAVGIFNSLMLNLEGRRVFQDTIDTAATQYKELPIQAKKALRDDEIEAKIAKIDTLMNALEAEIRNPIMCGYGPEAMRILKQIRDELPGFQPLSGGIQGCGSEMLNEKLDQLVERYRETIYKALYNSPLFVEKNYADLLKLRDKIILSEENAQVQLGQMRTEVNNGANVDALLNKTRPDLEKLAANYQSLATDLMKNSRPDVSSNIQSVIDLSSVRNLGEWSQIVNLFVSRLNKVSTWVYLFIAVFLDFMLVYLFTAAHAQRQAQPSNKPTYTSTINNPWQ